MKKEDIHLSDLQRILFGEAPPGFLLEVLVRSLVIYIAAIIVVRWMGKRMNGQLTILEMSVMVMMGAILAVPMQIPDRGLFQGFFVLFCMLVLLRTVNSLGVRSSRFEKLVQGEVTTLVKNGVIDLHELKKTRITRQQLFEILRSNKVFQLGKVKRLYLEACGTFSLYTGSPGKPGLPVFPNTDQDALAMSDQKEHPVACCNCGQLAVDDAGACPNCGQNKWSVTII